MQINFFKKKRILSFTLLEILLVSAVFLILLGVVASFFGSSQKAWTSSANKAKSFENARVALELMGRHLNSIYYKEGNIPFYHKGKTDYNGELAKYNNESLNFVANLSGKPNENCVSNLCEVKYQLYPTNPDSYLAGWVRLSVTGDKKKDDTFNSKWNFFNNDNIWSKTDSGSVFTADASSRSEFQKLIPNVTELSFTCYESTGDEIKPENSSFKFPFSIEITLKVMGESKWEKWLSLKSDNSDKADNFRKANERKFTQTVFLGNKD